MKLGDSVGVVLAAAVLAVAPAAPSRAAEDQRTARAAASEVRKAERALGRRDAATAIALAEQAVMRVPGSAPYRMLLGRAYLAGGRFAAAASAFGDVLTLDPASPGAGLKLVLAQVATGDRAAALATLTAQEKAIGSADRGLVLALAGDPAGAVALLMAAARSPGADARVRQNLALAYALAGEWPSARVVAATDLPPAEVDRRLQQWAAFAQPRGPADQVAALLGVTPVVDPGQPLALALRAPAPIPAAVSPVEALAAAIMPPLVVATVAPAAAISFGPRREVVQPLPTSVTTRWYVQFGAYPDKAQAQAAWQRVARRDPTIAGLGPQGMEVRRGGGTLFRLSVGGLALGDADRLCRRHRAGGGHCFVRAGAGDQAVAWDRADAVEVAAR